LIIIQNFGCGKAGIDFNAKRLGLFTKPATKITKRNNVIAMLFMLGGVGMRKLPVLVKNMNLSAVTGVSSGAPRSCQSGINSFRLRGSRTAPDRI